MGPGIAYKNQKTNTKKQLRNADEVRELWITKQAHGDGSSIDDDRFKNEERFFSRSEDLSSAKFHEKYKGSPVVVKAALREERAENDQQKYGSLEINIWPVNTFLVHSLCRSFSMIR